MSVISQLPIANKNKKWEIDKNCISFCAKCSKMFCFNSDGVAIKVPDEDMKNLAKEGILGELREVQLQIIQARFKV